MATALALAVVLVSERAASSEALKYAAAFTCEPMKTIEATVKLCRDKNSSQASQYASAFAAWHERNARTIPLLEQECQDGLRSVSSNAAEFRELLSNIEQINAEAIENIKKQVQLDEGPFCVKVLDGMASDKSDLEQYLSRKK